MRKWRKPVLFFMSLFSSLPSRTKSQLLALLNIYVYLFFHTALDTCFSTAKFAITTRNISLLPHAVRPHLFLPLFLLQFILHIRILVPLPLPKLATLRRPTPSDAKGAWPTSKVFTALAPFGGGGTVLDGVC
mmetsp:Transcript_18969/g.34311  ORF Transcript_18969/g.34311 Transcript_18969/m.34311 type:complete len:132 (+) Transcript_18969:17-412(+)